MVKKVRQFLILAAMLSAVVARGQYDYSRENAPSRVDLFAGYSIWLPNGSIQKVPFPDDTRGLIASGAYYLNSNFGFEFDGDYHFSNNNDSMVSVAIGPILRRPLSRGFGVFGHALAGAGDIIGPDAPLIGGGGYRQGGADWGPQITLGGGLDYTLPYFQHHLGVRLFQADYLYEHIDFGAAGGSTNLNSGRFSTGLVWHLGSVQPPPPVAFTCAVIPDSIFAGDPLSATGTATNLDPHRKAAYQWAVVGFSLSGTSATFNISSSNLPAGTYTVTGHVSEGRKPGQSADCSTQFTVKAFEPPTLSCSANPTTVDPTGTVMITAHGVSPQNRPLNYTYSASAGSINGNGATARLSVAGAPAGPITVSCGVSDDKGHTVSATTSVHIEAPLPPPAPKTQTLCSINFGREPKRPTRVNNEAKACLDDVALIVLRQADATLVLVGNSASDEPHHATSRDLAAQRSINTKDYLVKEKGIDPARIQARKGNSKSKEVDNYLVPAGATFINDISGTSVVDESPLPPEGRR